MDEDKKEIRRVVSHRHKLAAQEHRRAAREAEAAGYAELARVDWELAEMLDPTPRERTEPVRTRHRRTGPKDATPPDPRTTLNLGPPKRTLRANVRPARHERPAMVPMAVPNRQANAA